MAGGGVSFSSSGKGIQNLIDRLKRQSQGSDILALLDKYGAQGVAALAAVTPVDTGATAQAWSYEVFTERGVYGVRWRNSNMAGGTPVAILLQYGHGTGTGGYVVGRDYINPVMQPIFASFKADVAKVVSS